MAKFVHLRSASRQIRQQSHPAQQVPAPAVRHEPLNKEIDFSLKADLEAYLDQMKLGPDAVEGWIRAGLLFPDEMRVAEKMLQILRSKQRRPS